MRSMKTILIVDDDTELCGHSPGLAMDTHQSIWLVSIAHGALNN